MGSGVVTTHIREMLAAAVDLALQAEQGQFAAGVKTAQALERAGNLAAHAAEELRDEMLQARDGWPRV